MKLLVRKLLLTPFYLLTLAVDAAGGVVRHFLRSPHRPRPEGAFTPGISVVIPERANRQLLSRCLRSVLEAGRRLDEPLQVVVVVSDAQRVMYADLTEEFPVDWIFRSEPLWFVEAVALGLRAAKYNWVYLLNTDMVVDPEALVEVAKWRSPSVFAIASQIYFQDPGRRREETGLTEIRDRGGLLEILDAMPEDDHRLRTHAYAGGGSSLFQRELLDRFIEGTREYAPFYWEDVEWSVLAWRSGFEVLFCPQSRVWHVHRGTNSKFFSPEEIDRIFRRNGVRFQLRMALPPKALRTIFGTIARLDAASYREFLSASSVAQTLRSRFRSYFDPPFNLEPVRGVDIHYSRPRTAGKPLVLIVSPYCVYPPAHGGARRIHALIERLAARFDIILLSDEPENYSEESLRYFGNRHLVCLVGGRTPLPDRDGRIDRIHVHSHAALAAQLRSLAQVHDPAIVQIEYVELAKLVENRDGRPWILTLHDVLLEEAGAGTAAEEDQFEQQFINRFDAVVVCSLEDGALLRRDNVHIVHNGADVTTSYVPSPLGGPILFLGPFRYAPNLRGIIEFLNEVFPSVRREVPAAQLWILGGANARIIAARYPCFDQPGVTVFDFIEDVQPYIGRCSLTINPDKDVRGSSLKVIESLAAGRVCVSTRDGARGLGADLPSLVIADEKDFASYIVRLLTDVDYRHRLEVPTEELHRYSWQRAAEEQARIYRSLLQTGYCAPRRAFAQAGTGAP